MNQALAQAQVQGQQPPGAMPVPPGGVQMPGGAPGFVAFTQPPPPPPASEQQQQQQVPQWGPAPGAGAPPPPLSQLFQALGPLASQMSAGAGAPQGQTQDFGDITFTTDMNFVLGPQQMGGANGATAAPAPVARARPRMATRRERAQRMARRSPATNSSEF